MHPLFFGTHTVWMAMWWIVGVVFILAVFWLLLAAVNLLSTPDDSAQTILRRRYAAGEIDNEEFERRLAELSKTRSAA